MNNNTNTFIDEEGFIKPFDNYTEGDGIICYYNGGEYLGYEIIENNN